MLCVASKLYKSVFFLKLQSLLIVLMRFREHKHTVFAYIEGMFMQVGLLESDHCSFRIFTFLDCFFLEQKILRHELFLLFAEQPSAAKTVIPKLLTPRQKILIELLPWICGNSGNFFKLRSQYG